MTNEFMREERYIVFKISGVVEHLTTTEALHLARLYEIQRVGRKEAGKAELECVVVEKDWPEYEPTWRAIEARTTGAQPAPSESSITAGIPSDLDFMERFAAFVAATEREKCAAKIDAIAHQCRMEDSDCEPFVYAAAVIRARGDA